VYNEIKGVDRAVALVMVPVSGTGLSHIVVIAGHSNVEIPIEGGGKKL
jgi:hypothetical protein